MLAERSKARSLPLHRLVPQPGALQRRWTLGYDLLSLSMEIPSLSTSSPSIQKTPPRGRLSRLSRDVRDMFAELSEYRELLFAMTRRDLLLRYKQTIMGFGWAILMPVTYMVLFSVIFTRVVPLETGMPYPVFAYTGLLPWNLFSSSLRFATNSLVANRTLVTKVYFPREILPFSMIMVSLVDFAVGTSILALLMIWYQIPITWTIVLLPLILIVQLMFTAGVTLLLSMANLFFRDVKYLLEIVITLWMFATSVVYPVDRVGGLAGKLLMLNPMTPIIDAYRNVLLKGELPAFGPFAYAAALSVVLLAVAWTWFHRTEPKFAESV